MNAVGYIRISTKDQSQYSLEYQEQNVRQYCERNGLTLAALFKDDGESSYTFDRPDWKALEAFIKKTKSVEYLVIFDHDRFSRNLAEALMKIKELQEKFGIKILATTESFDTDFSDPSTFMMRAFKYMMAENELWRIRSRTKAGMYHGALSGRFLTTAPFGFKNERDGNKRPILTVNEERAVIIKTIFKEFLRGLSVEQIRKIVVPMGFTLKGKSSIQHVLSNPVYAGLIKVPAYKGSPERLVKGIHPALISESDYWAVQQKLNSKRSTRQAKEEVPLRGVLRCHICNRHLTAGNSKGNKKYYWYYVCSEHRINLSGVKLHKHLYEILDDLSFDEKDVAWFHKKLSESISKTISEKTTNTANAQKELRKVNEKIISAEEKYLLTDDISMDVYKTIMTKLKTQQIELQKKLLEYDTDYTEYWQKLNEVLPKLRDLRQVFESFDLLKQQQFLNMVFGESLQHDGEVYRTSFLHPLFAHNRMTLKEKGLLIIEQPASVLLEMSGSAPDRS